MANLSDAWGDITVTNVGKEFVEFLNEVQGEDAYYTLVDREDLKDVKIDKDNNLKMPFSTYGRWAYDNNIEGYLNGTWMGEHQEAYDKFIKAMKDKNGFVQIEYKDIEGGSEFMGAGVAELSVDEGEIMFNSNFEDMDYTVANLAELNGDSQYWALEYLYGDEVIVEYDKYVEKWHEDHKGDKFRGMNPASPGEWYENEYEEE